MSGQFKVGEVCVGQHLVNYPEYNGVECVVVSGLVECFLQCERTGTFYHFGKLGYNVRWADGAASWTLPINLRRKQPPAGEQTVMDWFKLPAPREVEAA